MNELYWGYKHLAGTYQAKRYFGGDDILNASESPFCVVILGPFQAKNREEALDIVKERVSEVLL